MYRFHGVCLSVLTASTVESGKAFVWCLSVCLSRPAKGLTMGSINAASVHLEPGYYCVMFLLHNQLLWFLKDFIFMLFLGLCTFTYDHQSSNSMCYWRCPHSMRIAGSM